MYYGLHIHTHSHTRTRRLNVFNDEQVSLGRSRPPSAEAYPHIKLANDDRSPVHEIRGIHTRYSNTGSGMPATGGVVYYVENSEYTKPSKSCLNLEKAACLYIL